MCGLAGYTSPEKNTKDVLSRMLEVIRHRGPDDENVYFDQNLALGHVRLSVIDVNGGKQPRIEEKYQGAALIFNGEIYGYKEIADNLRAKSCPLLDKSDTEVLFWLLKTKGIHEVVKQIDGMFAFIYRPEGSNDIYLVRDRFGEKPLYYGVRNGQLIFASEVNAILQHPLFKNYELDETAISQFLTLEYIPGDRTGIKDIYKVLPGHIVKYKDNQLSTERYWHPELNNEKVNASVHDRLNKLDTLLSESVKKRMIADVPVGVFMSGGLDSSLVAAIAAREANDISTFTVRMPLATFDESNFAKITSDHLGIKHNVLEVSNQDLLNALEIISHRIDQPFADSSIIPSYLVCQCAKQSVTVALGGDGADELFAGYPNFKIARFTYLMEKLPSVAGSLLRRILKLVPASNSYMNYSFLLKQLSYGFGHSSVHQPFHWMSAFSKLEQSELWQSETITQASFIELSHVITQLVEICGSKEQLNIMLFLFMTTYLPDDILMKVDRASMYNSLEVRSPYLGRDFSEYALSLSIDDKLHGFKTKNLLKELAMRYLPKEIVNRKKHGFALPISDLMRGIYKDRIESVLFDQHNMVSPWFNKSVIERYWKEHQEKRRDHGKKLWTLYSLRCFANNVNYK